MDVNQFYTQQFPLVGILTVTDVHPPGKLFQPQKDLFSQTIFRLFKL